ncbi:PGLP1B [Symbiodinium pilosum]|uniref:PGLP1B protein n=1 Tax=Symbiodinium pilosum TaxID=2952 RepID=A0A812TWC2_SYMPI|nr:PGLP1B [Symbiodinium pilosum]
MHGYGMYLYFSVGADKRFTGFSMNGKFASGAAEQEEATMKAFLQEYGTQCVQSATAALRDLVEKAAADGVPADFLVAKDGDGKAEKSVEDMVSAPYPEASVATQASLQAFSARLFAEEQPLQVSIYTGLSNKKLMLSLNEESSFSCLGAEDVRMDGARLKRQQLQVAGQAVEFFLDSEAAGALRVLVLVNMASEFEWEAAKWKLVHCESA